MKKKLVAIFAGISLLITLPERLMASVSKAILIGKWDCKSTTFFDGGIYLEQTETDIRDDGVGYFSGKASFLFTEALPRNYKFIGSASWSLSGNSWTTQLKSYQAMEIGPNHDENSIDLNKEIEIGTISSAEVLKATPKEAVFVFDYGTISYCSKL